MVLQQSRLHDIMHMFHSVNPWVHMLVKILPCLTYKQNYTWYMTRQSQQTETHEQQIKVVCEYFQLEA
jgi:hypothetical protein